MFGIKKHVLRLGNSMVASDMSFEPIKNQTKPNQSQTYNQNHGFGQFVAQSDMLGIKKHVLKLGNSALFAIARLIGITCQNFLVF